MLTPNPCRASLQPERAQSRPGADGASLDSSIAAATAAMEEAGGLPEAVHQAEVHSAGDAAAAAAAAAGAAVAEGSSAGGAAEGGAPAAPTSRAPPNAPAADVTAQPMSSAGLPPAHSNLPPMVHVPWQRKPIMNPLSAGEAADPLASPRKPSASSSFGSVGESFTFAAGKGAAHGPGGHTGSGSHTPSFASPNPSTQPSDGSRASSVIAGPSSPRQHWDLSFETPAVEAGFK